MAFTDHSNLYASVHEDGFNLILRHMQQQRPSLFNYGSAWFAASPDRLCHEIKAHPEVLRRSNPLVTVEEPLPIPGSGGAWGVDFCVQLTEAQIDFHPETVNALPPELRPLDPQMLSLHAKFCVGIRCPDLEFAERIGDDIASREARDDREKPDDAPRPPLRPIPGREVKCFCLEIFAKLRLERLNVNGVEHIVLRLRGFEIVDIRPQEMEDALECYVQTVLRVGILPKARIAVDTMAFEMGDFMTLTASLTPLSADVPNNPAVEEDEARLFIDLGIS
ncbi:hypothetical protein [Pseudooceanicola sp. LIPI14-2-Ac024]|uniref:hypothetical protein n=1 Tax=Pseudooceanicola sp. LIPI14-2-Ac024 TaxID=3344875 RepID=UPI0035D05E23